MKRLGVFVAVGVLFAAAPSFAQTVGNCPRGGGANQPPPVRVLFELGSAQIRASEKSTIAQAAATAKARQVSAICLIGHTDKLGDKSFNEKLARSRAQAVAAQMIRDGVPASHLYIVADPEAFGNMSLGKEDCLGGRPQGNDLLFALDSGSPDSGVPDQTAISITALPTTLRSTRARKASAARSIGNRCEMCGRMTPRPARRGSSST